MWPTSASDGPPAVPGTRTHELPRTSEETSPTGAAAALHTAATARSCPEGPGVVSRRSSNSGRGTAAGHYLRRLVGLRASVPRVNLRTLPDSYAVVRLQPGSELPEWVDKGPFRSVTRTEHEVSVVCRDHDVPEGESVDRGFTVLEVMGPLDFSLTGVIASLVAPLAEAEVPIFLISTFESDYVLVRSSDLGRAADALEDAGHVFAA